ncbi:hypothetical protein ACHAXR_002768 [Thalassiosira sp. AJA248-18]
MMTSEEADQTLTILQRGPHHIVALKPPAVVCHHSGWTGSRAKTKRGDDPEIPMIQRVRDAIHDIDTRDVGVAGDDKHDEPHPIRKVNLIHRLDRGTSGAMLFTFADEEDVNDTHDNNDQIADCSQNNKGNTAQLIEAMKSPKSIKTYVALVRGEGILRGEDLKKKGWFEISQPIKDVNGKLKDAKTVFNFVSGQSESSVDRPRIALVLARPKDGRWHQVRKHLNGLSHPILGDAVHGHSKINREWKEKRGMPGERIALHLGRLQLVPTKNMTQGIDVSAPILDDMLSMLRDYAPDVLEKALPILEKEGILVKSTEKYEVGRWTIPEAIQQLKAVVDTGEVEILDQSEHYIVVRKPPVVVVQNPNWVERSDPKRRRTNTTPMLQRVLDKTGRQVGLVHRLDRASSGCLLFSFASIQASNQSEIMPCVVTKVLTDSFRSPKATKIYLALCDGDGTWNGINYLKKGWFTFDNPVKDEEGKVIEDARTDFFFIASTIVPPIEHGDGSGRKVCITLARPHTGYRWHQIRQHLASNTIGHPTLGDSSHGDRTRTNRIWKKKRHLMKERVCLHLSRVQLPATEYSPEGIDVACPLPEDLIKMLSGKEMRELLDKAKPILAKEGITI